MKKSFMLWIELTLITFFLLGCVTLVNNHYYFESYDEVKTALLDSTDGPESCGGMTLTHLDADQFEVGFISDSFHELGGVGSLQARNAGKISIVHLGGIVSLYEMEDEALLYVMVAIACGVPQVAYTEDDNAIHNADELGFRGSRMGLLLSYFDYLDVESEIDHPAYGILSQLDEMDSSTLEQNSYRYGHLNNELSQLIRVTFYYPSNLYQEAYNETEMEVLSALSEHLEPLGYPAMTILSTPSNLNYVDGILSWTDEVNTGDFEYEVRLQIGMITHILTTLETSLSIEAFLISGDYRFTFSVQAISDDPLTVVSPKAILTYYQNESGVSLLSAPTPQNIRFDTYNLVWDAVTGVSLYQVKAVFHDPLGGTMIRTYPTSLTTMSLQTFIQDVSWFEEIELSVQSLGVENNPDGSLGNPLSDTPYYYNSAFSESLSLYSTTE